MKTQKRTIPPKKQTLHAQREIARLRRELAAERRQNARLEREIAELKRSFVSERLVGSEKPLRRLRQKAKGAHREELLLDEANRRAHRYRKRTFLRYLLESIMESAPLQLVTKMLRSLRRMQVVQTLSIILLAVFSAVTVAVVSATLLPILFCGTIALTVLALLRSRRMNRILRRELKDRRIRILIPPRGGSLQEGSFFIRNARAMAAERGSAVVVISPYSFSRRGLGGRGHFYTARKEGEGLYLVRRHYFFILRRRVLDALDSEITLVY